MSSEYANKLKKIAFTSELYNGLAQSFDQFPSLCEAPATISRKLNALTHFTLALSEDGAGPEYSSDEDDEEDNEGHGEDEEVINHVEVENTAAQPQDDESNGVQDDEHRESEDDGECADSLDEETIVRRFLDPPG